MGAARSGGHERSTVPRRSARAPTFKRQHRAASRPPNAHRRFMRHGTRAAPWTTDMLNHLKLEIDHGTPARTSTDQVTLEIDGFPVSVPKGTSLMRAAV